MTFINEYAKELYEFIIDVNREIMEDKNQKSIHEFKIINEASLIDYCNSLYGTIPFSDEYYCKTFEEGIALTIFRLNTSHCFLDGNKRTTLLTVIKLIENSEYKNFSNDFFVGVLTQFLIEMLEDKLNEEKILKWVIKQFKSTMI